jgi:peptidoglycan pentaglycine glycine transferase (the first glycine)
MENIEFLQSEEWRKFQESTGKRTFHVESGDLETDIMEHKLPVVGSYFYIPRGPVLGAIDKRQTVRFFSDLVNLAKKEKAGWIRFDPGNSDTLDMIRSRWRIVKAPHDMQSKEVFVINISKSEEELLSDMKQKTRYNIRLAEKRNVLVHSPQSTVDRNKYVDEFLRLVKATAKRKGVKFHPESYYRKMIETIPKEILRLYVAEYKDKIIASDLIAFYGNTATYLHGATDDEYRNVMASYLLQWQVIRDAKGAGCKFYDMGGVNTEDKGQGIRYGNNWGGITKFKLGFSLNTRPVKFPGSYDIVVNPLKYYMYRVLRLVVSVF